MTCRVLLGSTLVAGVATVLAGLDAGINGGAGPAIRPHVPLPAPMIRKSALQTFIKVTVNK
jgi:hypothetical protein